MSDPGTSPDALDAEILSRLGSIHDRLDPAPAVLDDLVLFSLGAARLDAEVARLVDHDQSALARGESRTRSLTFAAGQFTLLITVVELAEGRVRLDGWLAPASEVEIELRLLGDDTPAVRTRSEPTGRFVFGAVARRSAQFLVHTDPRPVITHAVAL